MKRPHFTGFVFVVLTAIIVVQLWYNWRVTEILVRQRQATPYHAFEQRAHEVAASVRDGRIQVSPPEKARTIANMVDMAASNDEDAADQMRHWNESNRGMFWSGVGVLVIELIAATGFAILGRPRAPG